MLYDCGAGGSFLGTDSFADLLKNNPDLTLEDVDDDFELADGSPLHVLGQVELPISIGLFKTTQYFIVADLGNIQGILGLDFIEDNDIQTRLKYGYFVVGDMTVSLHRDETKQCGRISHARTVTVPPRSIKVVNMRVRCTGDTTEGMIEPAKSLARTGLLVARSVASIKNGRVPIQIMNVHDTPIQIQPRRTPLGIFHPISNLVGIVSKTKDDSISFEDRLYTKADLPDHIKPTLEDTELTPDQESSAVKMILRYLDVFTGPNGEYGRTHLVKHTIDTGDHKPVRQPARRLTWARQEEADRQLDDMLEKGVAEPSQSPWSSPIVLASKPDGSIRFCVDYRQLNDLTRKDSYPLPRIDETLDQLAGAEWFCTSDLASGYWQVAMGDQDKAKTAFITRRGLFQFTVMPFGLANAPATFQRLMELVMHGLQWEHCLIYLDDIIVFGRNFDETLNRLEMVLGRLRGAGLKLKPTKCHWFKRSVKFLGHVVSAKGVQCDPDKLACIVNWHAPRTVREVRSFLGLVSYYRRFIPDCSTVMKPLLSLLRKKVRFVWNSLCEEAFENLKTALTSSPILAFPNRHDQFILDTDASDFGTGAVLSQLQDGVERVIAYGSHALNAAQQRYCTTKRELLAVHTYIHQFRHFLQGRHFLIRTDHSYLTWLKNFKNAEGMLGRWLMEIDIYDFKIEHRKGELHGNADGVSRRTKPTTCCPRPDCPDCKPLRDAKRVASVRAIDLVIKEDWSLVDARKWQREDLDIGKILQWMESSEERPSRRTVATHSRGVKALWNQWDQLTLRNGLLYRVWYPPHRNFNGAIPFHQLVAPKQIRQLILDELHNGVGGGHLGVEKTMGKLRQRFYWVGYKDDIYKWCRQCDTCAQNKMGPPRKRAPLQQIRVGHPLELIAIDVMGPLPETQKGNRFIVVVSDYFSKWTEAYAVRQHTAATVAEILVEQFMFRLGIPHQLHSDQGPEFDSALVHEVCKLLRIHKTRTTAYHPQSDGQVERANRTVRSMLTALVNEARDDWDNHLPYILFAYRASVHATTKCTQTFLCLIEKPICPLI